LQVAERRSASAITSRDRRHHRPVCFFGIDLPAHNGIKQPVSIGIDLPTSFGIDLPTHNGIKQPVSIGIDLPTSFGIDLPAHNGIKQPVSIGIDLPTFFGFARWLASSCLLASASWRSSSVSTGILIVFTRLASVLTCVLVGIHILNLEWIRYCVLGSFGSNGKDRSRCSC
jgi:hypothetical protein